MTAHADAWNSTDRCLDESAWGAGRDPAFGQRDRQALRTARRRRSLQRQPPAADRQRSPRTTRCRHPRGQAPRPEDHALSPAGGHAMTAPFSMRGAVGRTRHSPHGPTARAYPRVTAPRSDSIGAMGAAGAVRLATNTEGLTNCASCLPERSDGGTVRRHTSIVSRGGQGRAGPLRRLRACPHLRQISSGVRGHEDNQRRGAWLIDGLDGDARGGRSRLSEAR
jgi:hypothetical protein